MNIAHGRYIKTIGLPTKENPMEIYFRVPDFSAKYIDCCHADSVLKRVGLKAINGPELYGIYPAFDIIKAKIIPTDKKTNLCKISLLEMKADIDGLTLLSEEEVIELESYAREDTEEEWIEDIYSLQEDGLFNNDFPFDKR